jgi:GNAT superfamily N-acetyltransferase
MIRTACAADIPACCELLRQLFGIEADFDFDAGRAACVLAVLIDDDTSLVLVAEMDGCVIGMVSVQILISTAEGGPVGLLEDMVINAQHRGRGWGRQLLQAAVAWCRERGLSRVQLLADRGNQPALDFYRQQGWQETQLLGWRYGPVQQSR